jgi:hypothetical protein
MMIIGIDRHHKVENCSYGTMPYRRLQNAARYGSLPESAISILLYSCALADTGLQAYYSILGRKIQVVTTKYTSHDRMYPETHKIGNCSQFEAVCFRDESGKKMPC